MTAVKSDDGAITHFVMTYNDITERRAEEEEIKELVYYDSLTKLGNRRLLVSRLQQALERENRVGSHGALFFIDLDNFKALNDMAGHDVGDKLLQQVAARLTACVGEDNTVVRLGGDEFVVVLTDLRPDEDDVTRRIGDGILASLNAPCELEG